MPGIRNCLSWLGTALLFSLIVFVQTALSEDKVEQTSYHLFFTRSKHINQLLQAGQIEKASAIWNKEAEYFKQSRKPVDKKCTEDLADALETLFTRQAGEKAEALLAVRWPGSTAQWPALKRLISEANGFAQEVSSHQVLAHLDRSERIARGVKSAQEPLLEEIKADAPKEFVAYTGSLGGEFFSEYPVIVEPREFLRTSRQLWLKAMSTATLEEIQAFTRAYGAMLDRGD